MVQTILVPKFKRMTNESDKALMKLFRNFATDFLQNSCNNSGCQTGKLRSFILTARGIDVNRILQVLRLCKKKGY